MPRRAFAIAILSLVFVLPLQAILPSSTPPRAMHSDSERFAAALAAQLGAAFQDWRDGIQAPSSNPALAALDAEAIDLAIETVATALAVKLHPRPAEARESLPHNRDKQIQQAIAIVKEWHAQARTALKNNAYVGGYYMIGESVGLLRSLVTSPTVGAVQPIIDKLVPATTNIIGSSRLDISEDIQQKWLEIAIDLMTPRRTAEQRRSLRVRLDLWFEMLIARQRDKTTN